MHICSWKYSREKYFEVITLCELNFKDLIDYIAIIVCVAIVAKIFGEFIFEAGVKSVKTAKLLSQKFPATQ